MYAAENHTCSENVMREDHPGDSGGTKQILIVSPNLRMDYLSWGGGWAAFSETLLRRVHGARAPPSHARNQAQRDTAAGSG